MSRKINFNKRKNNRYKQIYCDHMLSLKQFFVEFFRNFRKFNILPLPNIDTTGNVSHIKGGRKMGNERKKHILKFLHENLTKIIFIIKKPNSYVGGR